MKMEGGDILKLSSSTKTSDTGLTFGPAWLRQLSSGDTNKTALPPSPGLAFQLSKHRYSREEMLAIYEAVEKTLSQQHPPNLATDFEDLFRKDVQRPVLLTALSSEEQKFLSTCVNSQVVLNSYNKIQGGHAGASDRQSSSQSSSNHNSNNSSNNAGGDRERGGLDRGSARGGGSGRGSRGGAGGGGGRDSGTRDAGGFGRGQSGSGIGDRGLNNDRERGGGGRGRGRGRGSESQTFKTIEEEPNSKSGAGAGAGIKGAYPKGAGGTFARSGHGNAWEAEGAGGGAGAGGTGGAPGKKEYSRAMTDENWRNRPNPEDESKVSTSSNEDGPVSSSETKSGGKSNDAGSKADGDGLSKSSSRTNNWRNDKSNGGTGNGNGKDSKEPFNSSSSSSTNPWTVSGAKKHSNQANNNSDVGNNNRSKSNPNENKKNERHPEWLNDDDEEMTFDDRGQFIPVKELKNKKAAEKPKTEANATTVTSSGEPKPTGDEGPKQKDEPEKVKSVTPPEEQAPSKAEEAKAAAEAAQKKSQVNEDINKLQALAAKQQAANAAAAAAAAAAADQQQQQHNALLMNQFKNFPSAAAAAADPAILNPAQMGSFADVAQNLVGGQQTQPVEADAKAGAVPVNHPDAYMWYYMDPQNQIQGAFSAEQMLGWFQAGYFALNLMVKRGCDDKFLPLGVVTGNWGRIPFTPGPQPQPFLTQPPAPPKQQGIWSKEQILQQMQLFQQLQQLQYFPQNFNLIRNELNLMPSNSNSGMAPLGNLMQQLQQLQMQQNTLASAPNNIGQAQLLSDLRNQQEALINQLLLKNNLQKLQHQQQQSQQGMPDSVADIDPAILGAAPAQMQAEHQQGKMSIWGDVQARISPMNQAGTPPVSISPMNNLAAGSNQNLANLDPTVALAQQLAAASLGTNMQLLNENNIKDKLQALFEQTKREEEKRRKMEEEYQYKLKREEEEKKRAQEELRMKEDELKRLEEERMRKEQQKKKLDELIKREEEERRRTEEALKKRKEEESKLKLEKLKQKQQQKEEQQKKLEQQAQQQQELEKQKQQQLLLQQQQQAIEQLKKQQAAQVAEQQKLNNLQLPAHANWGKGGQTPSQQQTQQLQLKAILEQQALESMQQRILEQQKQAELQANQQQNQGSGKWSSLFRGSQQALASSSATALTNPNAAPQPVSLATIQAEQAKLDTNPKTGPVTLSQKLQTNQPPPSAPLTMAAKIASTTTAPPAPQPVQAAPSAKQQQQQQQQQQSWASWTQAPAGKQTTAPPATSTSNDGGFWTDIGDKKSSGKAAGKGGAKNATNSDLNASANNNGKHHSAKEKKSAAQAAEENLQQTFLSNMTISEEFMKWCHEQLKDFHVELHVPTFVNFLREIEACADIENYVVDYLGDSKAAKEFAQQFYINRESQLREQANDDQDDNYNSGSNSKQSNRQKKRSKGQRVDHQLLGFTVQADPNLKNRGNIDPL